ncbi:VOC family protein [Paenibacillus harenae]|uniref:Catechol 2,3-dioxygenase-like lactoylglutathione lyase family enzyme n=1 Tax=Paenibacillus harenae TaxID=306543 RepID=A0ABT9U6A4_PAEHA|nr:VOC family protein [Paenibacillus harenae]MDQ0115153.1 catechol 2,3-dioxygenase-like lactoylglutathione lyase family enzyme [Paenibacillus harenae]
MSTEINKIHHVGHVVYDMEMALELYRKLGFICKPPAYPTMVEQEGGIPRPFGAANAHIDFVENFIEIVTTVQEGGRIPHDAHFIPLSAPPAVLSRIIASIKRTVATISRCLARFEGTHILVFSTSDAITSAARLDQGKVGHGGVNTIQRPVETSTGTQMVPVRLLEIDDEQVSEGRLAFAENPPSEALQTQIHTKHPNGAIELVEAILCVEDGELDACAARYRLYLGTQPQKEGEVCEFDLGSGRITIISKSRLTDLLPGEALPSLPGFAGYTVKVHNLSVTRQHLESNGFPVIETARGDVFVPGASLIGTALIFRQG